MHWSPSFEKGIWKLEKSDVGKKGMRHFLPVEVGRRSLQAGKETA